MEARLFSLLQANDGGAFCKRDARAEERLVDKESAMQALVLLLAVAQNAAFPIALKGANGKVPHLDFDSFRKFGFRECRPARRGHNSRKRIRKAGNCRDWVRQNGNFLNLPLAYN